MIFVFPGDRYTSTCTSYQTTAHEIPHIFGLEARIEPARQSVK